MSGPFNDRETEVVNAIADMLLTHPSPAIIRQTTLNQGGGSLVGDKQLTLANASGFVERGYLHFFDNSGEEMVPIDSVAGNVLHLDYRGYPAMGLPDGLAAVHANGSIVATNLMLHQPSTIAPMLRSGDPVFAIFPRQRKTAEFSTQSTVGPVIIRIQVHLPLNLSESDPIDPEVWNGYQQKRCRQLIMICENTLAGDRKLHSTYNDPGPHAQGLGLEGVKSDWSTTVWDSVTQNIDIPQAVAAMDVVVRPRRRIN